MYTFAKKDHRNEEIQVVTRTNGRRTFLTHPIDYSFYVPSVKKDSLYKNIFGNPVDKITPRTYAEWEKEKSVYSSKKLFESDANYVFRALAEHHRNEPLEDLHIAFIDIEAGFNKNLGYAPIDNPFNPIISVTVKLEWSNQLITLSLPPDTLSMPEALRINEEIGDCILFDDETAMLNALFDLLEDADIISGWNSEGYDLPYIINRTKLIMGEKDTRRLCLWGSTPKEKRVVKYDTEVITYELVGRTHLDLMDVYRKFTYEERHSYSLDAISEYELGQRKVPYSGSLDDLYRKDYKLFLEYNRQDVTLLSLLEKKLRFISLLNDIAHDTCTLITTGMGTVAMVDQAITNRAHDMGMVVPDRAERDEDERTAPGAHVAEPKVGVHEYVGVIDINSLYPSAIRALNMGIETMVAQLRPNLTEQFLEDKFKDPKMTTALAWQNQFGSIEYQMVMAQRKDVEVIIDWSDGTSIPISAHECYRLIFEYGQKWVLSGNGTIFSYEREAVIPGLLADWYATRKKFQRQKEEAHELMIGISVSEDLCRELEALNG